MSATLFAGPPYSRVQRLVALSYGVACHTFFAASVVAMCASLYTGLTSSLLHFHGWKATLLNTLLIVQFAALHSLFLGDTGRKLLARLAPLGLGRDLTTTIYSAIASLQLLATFVLWSPSEVLWVVPAGALKVVLTILYGIAWLLLVKSMSDAGMDLQTGMVGWLAVWRNRRPVYKPFARTGMFRHSRQPVYSSFALILWTAPVWTPDHLALAVGWTFYCIAAPLFKEKRYLRFYGEAFARYQRSVPYWIPGLRPKSMSHEPQTPSPPPDVEVAIVGAGPVGLLLANLLGARGLKVLVLEKRTELPAHSQAIGITPPSLAILEELGLADSFITLGLKIRDVYVHGETGHLGCCSFRNLDGQHRYILSLPQRATMALLENSLSQFPSVEILKGKEVTCVLQTEEKVYIDAGDRRLTAGHLVACDGWRSKVRDMLKIRTKEREYGCHFLMGDFMDSTGMGDAAHLFFTAEGAVESFPLPDFRRRWIVQTSKPATDVSKGFLGMIIQERTGLVLKRDEQLNQSAFTPRRQDCEVYHDGRVILCGDAAHAMSPIGGQGMNTGFADAALLAEVLALIIKERRPARPLLEAYQRERQRAARMAADRAAQGMWLGTRTGRYAALARDYFMREILFRKTVAQYLGPRFAMLTLPVSKIPRPDTP